ncbi:A disintegrin and metalloproteinase with thrombospondin motifs adt-1-like [Haliotis cracherodii]|uniref:A disintegrin and metalloproteinase with thrombospondin motifs adt-1-like n=1 Tax=Haliotis cracherodii TaxID=6455 RepID=UPI0039E8107D
MSAATLLSVFALLLITCVPQTEAQAGQVCVDQMKNNVDEDKGPVIFQFVRKQGSNGTISVSYNLTDVTTEPGDINGSRNGTIIFRDGETAKNLSVEINDDKIPEDSEQFSITLTGGTGPETIATAIIVDNDFYSSWGEWVGDCSGTVTCGPANKTETRNRTCIAVVPPFCMESLTENRTVDCNLPDCPIITLWSEWTDNGTCSTTCGPGTRMQFRNRTCTANCPTDFTSVETRTVDCQICTCPVISMWSEWADNSACSTSCGPGTNTQMRTRACTNSNCCPADLTLVETRTVDCQICTCPVISMWSEWADNSACSTSCGPGTNTQMRTRACTNSNCCPADLTLVETRTVDCQICTCPVISMWSEWADNSACSTSCGPGTNTQMRTRACTNSNCCPADLTLVETRSVDCQICTCPVISMWSEWADNSACSTSCGPGTNTQMRTRACTNSNCCPADLTLVETRTVDCQICTCPVISMWSEWADNSACSTSCGPGTNTQMRTRACTNSNCCPADLTLVETRTVDCQICTCPVISMWSEWADNSACSTSCGPGTNTQMRTRACTNSNCCPADLTLVETRTVDCQICTCPVISMWSEWADNSACSTSCGPGTNTQMRTRACTNSNCCPADLTLVETRTVDCQICTCPVISMWSEWADNSACSTSCGPGTNTQMRTRACTNSNCCPADLTLVETRTVDCQICTCPVISMWSEWADNSACSTSCGPGTNTQMRTRACTSSNCCPADLTLVETRTVDCQICTCPGMQKKPFYCVDDMEQMVWIRFDDMEQMVRFDDMEQMVRTVDMEQVVRSVDMEQMVRSVDMEQMVRSVDMEQMVRSVDMEQTHFYEETGGTDEFPDQLAVDGSIPFKARKTRNTTVFLFDNDDRSIKMPAGGGGQTKTENRD